ncbi:cell division protein ZapA [Sphingobium sp. OAS761]|uniref:cell division protein ZapA n=1 Tax=Sphingobium sp. OAS761 TaxID=2817901 RepID=UPI0020A02A4A|nr:cell division protein ZapA [Sphingobium sp. OAS761]MCP1472104.1 cell division protein ZapA [Sphingobium sp. OAS761]
MAETMLHIAGRQYPIRCRDGEEAQLSRLAAMIQEKAEQAQQATPGLTEVRTLLFSALFLADELADMRREMAGHQARLALETEDDAAAGAIEGLTERIEKLRATLAAGTSQA